MSQSFFAEIARRGALLTNYHALTHPSQPNYIALTSGDFNGVRDDRDHNLDVPHLGDLLERKGKTWKNYAEDFPGKCYEGPRKGLYARKHTPFVSYNNVRKSERCRNIVPSTAFYKDVKKNSLPDFSFYTPNMKDDGHDTGVTFGDEWFRKSFEPLLTKPGFKNVTLVVTFDENECNTVGPFVSAAKNAKCKSDLNRIYTVLYGYGVKAGSQSSDRFDHYSLLRTIEVGFGLDSLGKNDDKATVITGVWE